MHKGQNKKEEETQDINVENPLWWEKPRQPIDCKIHYVEEITTMGAQGQRPLAPPSLRHTRRLQPGGNYLFLSLSLSLSHALYNCTLQNINNHLIKNVRPKSNLYIYDFRVIYTNVHTNRSDRSESVLGSAGSLYPPSGGTCFPTLLSRAMYRMTLLVFGELTKT